MADEPKFKYGFSTQLMVTRKPGGETFLVSGVAEDASRWTRVLSQRAAQVLWFSLTRFLYPEKSDKVTSAVMTAPMRDAALPTITTHTSVEKRVDEKGGFEILGFAGNTPVWLAQLTPTEAEQFWKGLNDALHPPSAHGNPPKKQ